MIDLDYFKQNLFGYRQERFPVSFRQKRKVISCERCKGIGRVSQEELTDYHKREYDTFYSDCKECNGEGRVILTEVFVSFGDVRYDPALITSQTQNILFQKLSEPYSKEKVEGIERENISKTFYFQPKDIKEA